MNSEQIRRIAQGAMSRELSDLRKSCRALELRVRALEGRRVNEEKTDKDREEE